MAAKRDSKGRFIKRGAAKKSGGTRKRAAKKNTPAVVANKPAARRRAPSKTSMRKRAAGMRRNSKGHFVRSGGFSRAKRNPPRARSNASPVLTEVLKIGGAALLGGIAAYSGMALTSRMTENTTVRDVGSVVVPGAIAAVASQFSSPYAEAAAFGALGVAGVGLAKAISGSIMARTNPPPAVPWVWDNPPLPPQRLIAGALPSAWASPFRS